MAKRLRAQAEPLGVTEAWTNADGGGWRGHTERRSPRRTQTAQKWGSRGTAGPHRRFV